MRLVGGIVIVLIKNVLLFQLFTITKICLDRIECNAGSEKHKDNCKNRRITLGQRKVLTVDVQEC